MTRTKIYRNDTVLILIAFGTFFTLTVGIAVIGILQIYSLSETIRELGYRHLPRERVIVEMKINNELYVTGISDYVRLATAGQPVAGETVSGIQNASVDFKKYLGLYSTFAVSQKQQRWGKVLASLMDEVESVGKDIINFVAAPSPSIEELRRLLNDFGTKSFKVYELLSGPMGKDNLNKIEKQLQLAGRAKETSISILLISLAMSIVLGVIIASIVYTSLKEEHRRRRALVRRMISLEEEERKNLSRQVHDQLSQDLGALKIYLELFSKNVPDGQVEQKEKLKQSREILSRLIDKGHNISELLRPPELDDWGLIESIGSLVNGYRDITECKYEYYKPELKFTLSPEYSLALYRVTQEALTNIIKYARAQCVTVSLQKKDASVYLAIRDDGVGFDYQKYLQRPNRRQEDRLKLGLNGLRERIELLDGRLDVTSTPGKGTKIEVELGV